MIFKIVDRQAWEAACDAGQYRGSAHDLRDGFIHFSAAHQVRETAAKHFKNIDDLLLVAIDEATIGQALIWEPSRGGDLFPHLYGALPTSSTIWTRHLTPGTDGVPQIPEDIAA